MWNGEKNYDDYYRAYLNTLNEAETTQPSKKRTPDVGEIEQWRGRLITDVATTGSTRAGCVKLTLDGGVEAYCTIHSVESDIERQQPVFA